MTRKLQILMLAAAAGVAGGCSTMTEMAGIPHAGHQPDGGYVLLASEQQLDCRRLADEIELGLKDMEKAKPRIDAERSAAPRTLVGLYGRMFGGADGGLKSVVGYRKSERRVRALNRQMQAKGCHSVDVDARIMAFDLAPLNMAKTGGAASKPAAPAALPASAGREPLEALKSEIDALVATAPIAR